MNTAVINQNNWAEGMIKLDFLANIFNPKLIGMILIFDVSGLSNYFAEHVFKANGFLGFLAILCIIDLLTGIWKVVITKGWKAVTSKGLRDTVSKGISYTSFIILFHVISQYDPNLSWLYPLATKFLIMVEAKSVYENITVINPKLDFIEGVMQKIVNNFKNKSNANS